MAASAPLKRETEFPTEIVKNTIRKWWTNEENALRSIGDPFETLPPLDRTVFDILPAIPSHQAVEVIGLLERILNRKISESVIKKGGYRSPDEFVDHLTAKLIEITAAS